MSLNWQVVFLLWVAPLMSHGGAEALPFKIENVKNESILLSNIQNGKKITISEFNRVKKPLLKFDRTFKAEECFIDKTKVCRAGLEYALDLSGAKKRSFQVAYKISGQTQVIEIQLLPDDFPSYKVIGKSSLDRPLIFAKASRDLANPQKPSHLFVLDSAGKIQFYQKMPGLTFDFRPHYLNGKTYYSYLAAHNIYHGVTFSGDRVLMDENFQVIKKSPEEMDIHEYQLLGENWHITTKYSLAKNSFGADFVNQEIVEVKNGKTIFQWGIDDLYAEKFFPIIASSHLYKGKRPIQQFHLNAFQQLPNNELLVSLGFDGVLLLDKPTKRIKWVFGGLNDQFGVRGNIAPFFHHTPNYDPKTRILTLFNNGLNIKRSQVLQYHLDIKNRKVTKYKVISDSGAWAAIMGSVEVSGNIFSIGFGSRDLGQLDFIEQDGDRQTMSISFEDPLSAIYRVYR